MSRAKLWTGKSRALEKNMKKTLKKILIILKLFIRHPRQFFRAIRGNETFNVRSVLTLNVWKRAIRWCFATLPRRSVSTLVIIALIIAPVYTIFFAKEAKAAWWNDNWAYRQKIQLTNSTGADLADFQVATTVDTSTLITAGKMQATTCADMRFTDSRGQPLDYWIEENNPGCNNASTRVWVKVPKVYNGTNAASIYMYYGNPSATAIQSGDKTFEFFDDFNGASLNASKWPATTGSPAISGGALQISTGSGREALRTSSTFTQSNAVMMFRSQMSATNAGTFRQGISNTSDLSTNMYADDAAYAQFGTSANDAVYASYNESVSDNLTGQSEDTSYHKYEISWAASTKFYQDGNLLTTRSAQVPNEASYIRLEEEYGSAGSVSTDWVAIRKYASADPTTSASAEERGPGPVAYWRFDEGQGTTAYNSTTQTGLNGSISGATWKPESECLSGKCLDYDGTDDVTTVTQNAGINLTGKTGYTISTWIKADGAGEGSAGEIIDKGANTYLRVDNPSGSNLDIEGQIDLGTTPANLNISTGAAINKWYHIEMVYADDSDDEIDIYINGVLKGTSINGVGSLVTETNNLLIGGDASHNFNGSLDETKIYPYARSAAQIQQEYNAGLSGSSAPSGSSASIGESPKWMTDGLVGHWKMDESSGTSVADASGNGNTGTLTNAQESGTSDASGNSVTTMVDTDGSLSSTDDAYNNMILRFTAACGSITDGTERTITDYTGTPHTFTVATLAQAPDSCAYEVRHQTGGKFGNGIMFDGKNDGVSATLSSAPTYYTVSAWINPRAIGTEGEIAYIGGNQFFMSTGGILWFNGYGNKTLTANRWYHVVSIVESGDTKIYIDGNLDATNGAYGTPGSSNVFIGDYAHIGSSVFDGTLDDVRVYNRALSPDEVRQLSEWGPGPVGWWKFDEGSGTDAHDTSGNNRTGTLQDSAGWDQGKYGKGVQMDGNNDSVQINDF